MATTISWMGETEQILHAVISGDAEMDELLNLESNLTPYITARTDPVVVILEFSTSARMMGDIIKNLGEFRCRQASDPDQALLTVLVLHSELQARIGDIFTNMSQRPVRVTRSLQEALVIANETLSTA